MSAGFAARLASSGIVAAALVLCGMQPAPPSVIAASAPPRVSLRIGLWTLWHDREAVLSPAGSARAFTVRTCDSCVPHTVAQPATVRADGDGVILLQAGKTSRFQKVETAGAATFTAHGEKLGLSDPVTITARGGVLIFAVRLAVESYVERVVASESGPADTLESLKALAIVVRTYALHESHGHTITISAIRPTVSFCAGAARRPRGRRQHMWLPWLRPGRRCGFTESALWATFIKTAAAERQRRLKYGLGRNPRPTCRRASTPTALCTAGGSGVRS